MVRKIVVITAALGLSLGLSTTASAQSITVGGEAGINIANVSVSQSFFGGADKSSRTGFWGGFFASIGITPIFGVRPEVLYSSNGFKLSDAGDEVKLSDNFIQIPLLVEAVIPVSNSPIRPVVFAGPAFGFEASCNVTGNISGVSVSDSCDDFGFDERKKTNFSIIFGGELGVAVGKVIPGVGVRYDLGLTNLDDSGVSGESLKNRTLTIYGQVGVPVK